MKTNFNQGLSTPTAIVIVGVLVAAAIFFGGNKVSAPKTPVAAQPGQVAADPKTVTAFLKDLDVDTKDYEKCVASEDIAATVQADFEEGAAAGVRGTPYSLVVDTKTGYTIPVSGARAFADLRTLFDAILADTPELEDASSESSISTDISGDYVRGSEDARIVVIEFSDLECPFCSRFHDTMKEAMTTYPDDVAWVYRHFPLDQIHPNARKAAAAVECIGEQKGADGYWAAIDAMFANPAIVKSI